MLLLDIPRLAPRGNRFVDIPFYHRPHLFLPQQRTLSLCLLPNASLRHTQANYPDVPELVVAPFEFLRWDRLWRFTATIADREGLLRDVFEIVKHYNGEILSSESGTSQEEGVHALESVLYIPSEEDAKRVEWLLGARFCLEASVSSEKRLRLSLKRMETLYRAKQQFDSLAKVSSGSFHPYQESNVAIRFAKSDDGRRRSIRLDLPDAVQSELARLVVETPGAGKKSRHDGYHVRMSDTKDRCLRITFLRGSDSVVHARVECKRTSTTAYRLAEALARDRFNVLSAFVTPATDARMRMELLVRLGAPAPPHTSSVKNALRRTLASLPHDFDVHYGHPENYSATWKATKVTTRQVGLAPAPIGMPLPKQLVQRLDSIKGDLEKSVAEPMADPDERPRLNFVRSLSSSAEALFGVTTRPSIFISCHYKNKAEISMLEGVATECDFTVVSGRELVGHADVRRAIRQAIDACDFFLGVWSRSGASGHGSELWPSSWLIWELGVADALDVPTNLLVSEEIHADAWKRIYPNVPVDTFNEASFERRARVQLKAIRKLRVQRRATLLRPPAE